MAKSFCVVFNVRAIFFSLFFLFFGMRSERVLINDKSIADRFALLVFVQLRVISFENALFPAALAGHHIDLNGRARIFREHEGGFPATHFRSWKECSAIVQGRISVTAFLCLCLYRLSLALNSVSTSAFTINLLYRCLQPKRALPVCLASRLSSPVIR